MARCQPASHHAHARIGNRCRLRTHALCLRLVFTRRSRSTIVRLEELVQPDRSLAVAEHWAKAVAMHEGSGSPVHIVEAAMAAQAYARLNRFEDARLSLDELTGILPQLQPRDWAFNGAVGRAAHAIWDMLDMRY